MKLETLNNHLLNGKQKEHISFDELICGLVGADEFKADELDVSNIEKDTILLLDSIGVNEAMMSEFLSNNDEISLNAGRNIAYSIANQYDDNTIFDNINDFEDEYKLNNYDSLTFDNISLDSAMPQVKTGYKRKLVVRNGKKVWINKRDPNKKVKLSPKQKMALAKARLKAHSSKAKLKRRKSMKLRKISF